MKTFFIHSTASEDIVLTKEALAKLPRKVGIVTNIQHLNKVQSVKEQLPDSVICGQVLGCRANVAERVAKDVDAFLFIGGGDFHPLFVAVKTGKDVFCWNPADQLLTKVKKDDVIAFNKNKERQLKIFYSARKVGVLVSSKQGQSDNKINSPSIEVKMHCPLDFIKRQDREYYLFAFDTLQLSELENFPFIDCWVNTACSRIADEKLNMVNVDDVLEFESKNK